MPTIHTAELGQLIAGDTMNPRRSGRADGASELQTSIISHGLLQPLLVRQSSSLPLQFEVIDGNRRLAALQHLQRTAASMAGSPISERTDIPIHILEDGEASSREAALAANIVRVPLHVIDQFEAFAALEFGGLTPTAIASRFGISERLVRQRIALGTLAPEILTAWRKGDLHDDAAEAFTLAVDQKHQLQVFQRLQNVGNLWASHVRMALGCNHNAVTAVRVIGADAYRAAGGDLIEDLFGGSPAISEPALATRMLADHLDTMLQKLRADGWSFAELRESVKDPWSWPEIKVSVRYKPDERARKTTIAARLMELAAAEGAELTHEYLQLSTELAALEDAAKTRSYKPDVKAQSGCLVSISNDVIRIQYAVQKPADARRAKQKPGANAPAGETKPTISNALAHDLSVMRTMAAAEALKDAPGLAVRALVAALGANGWSTPVKVKFEGLPALREPATESFEARLTGLLGVTFDGAVEQLVKLVATSLDLRGPDASAEPSRDHEALLENLPAGIYRAAAQKIFDARSYFSRVNAEQCKAALREILGADHRAPSKKPELIAAAVTAAEEAGWLPIELRHPAYRVQK